MRPHRLQVTAFGAFAGREEVNFDDLEGLFLLHGETCAGKTTLLDAIAFALYGRVPGERGSARRLRSDYAVRGTATEVELEATVGGRHLRVTRRPEQARQKRSGSGFTTEPASVRLDELAPSGAWESKSTRIGEVDAEIENLMGMSAAQFFQVVLLPQGEFARFLRADAKDKSVLLQRLFGTDRFGRVEDWLAERRRLTDKEVAAAEGTVSLLVAQVAQAAGTDVPTGPPAAGLVGPLPPGPSGLPAGSPSATGGSTGGPAPAPVWEATWAARLLTAAESESAVATAEAESRNADLTAALAARTAAERQADRQRRRRNALARQDDVAAAAPALAALRAEAEAAARAAEVAPVLDAADRATGLAAAAREAEASARSALADLITTAEAPGEPSVPGDQVAAVDRGAAAGDQAAVGGHVLPPADAPPELLRAAAGEQRAQEGRLDALRAVAEQAAAEDEVEAAARERVRAFDLELAACVAEAARRDRERASTAVARDTAAEAATALPAARTAADAARRMANEATALVAERTARDQLHQVHMTARETAVGLQEQALRIREDRIDGMRAELAASMTDGSPCPVCGSLDHPDPVEFTFAPVSREQEQAADERAAQAARAASQAGSEVAAAEARLDELTRRVSGAGFAGLFATVATDTTTAAALPGTPAATAATGTPASTSALAPAVTPAATVAASAGTPATASAASATTSAFTHAPDTSSPATFTLDSALQAPAATLAAAAQLAETEAARHEDAAGALADRAATLSTCQHDLDDLDEAIADGKATLSELTGQRSAALADADGAATRAADRRRELRAQLGAATDLDTALAEARYLAGALTKAGDAADETVRTTAEAREAAHRARTVAVAADFAPVGAEPAIAADLLGDAAAVVGFALVGAEPAIATGPHGEAAMAAARAAFREPAWRRDAAARITRHDAEAEAVDSLLADPELAGVALDPPAPVEAATTAAEAAQAAHDEAVGALGRALDRVGQLAALRPRLDGALAALEPVRERAGQVRQLADLANGNGSVNQYKMTLSSFVLAARLEEVAAAASERLLTMTAGRYSLVHSDARKGNAKAGLSLLACDAWTGVDRDTATLSGGETFLASLALALGLADVVTAESAGTPMEALFVDEGFGTLDEDALDEVMNVLDGLRAGGRVVGIVSHVSELRQRVPCQVHVRKSRTGSHVEVIAG